MGHIEKDNYENMYLDSDEVRFVRNMAWLRGTYSSLRQHDMDASFCNDPKPIRRVVHNYSTALTMGYFKVREVEVRNCGYTTLADVGNCFNKKCLGDVDLPVDELDSLPQE